MVDGDYVTWSWCHCSFQCFILIIPSRFVIILIPFGKHKTLRRNYFVVKLLFFPEEHNSWIHLTSDSINKEILKSSGLKVDDHILFKFFYLLTILCSDFSKSCMSISIHKACSIVPSIKV